MCDCPHHPFGCYGHPHGCKCATRVSTHRDKLTGLPATHKSGLPDRLAEIASRCSIEADRMTIIEAANVLREAMVRTVRRQQS